MSEYMLPDLGSRFDGMERPKNVKVFTFPSPTWPNGAPMGEITFRVDPKTGELDRSAKKAGMAMMVIRGPNGEVIHTVDLTCAPQMAGSWVDAADGKRFEVFQKGKVIGNCPNLPLERDPTGQKHTGFFSKQSMEFRALSALCSIAQWPNRPSAEEAEKIQVAMAEDHRTSTWRVASPSTGRTQKTSSPAPALAGEQTSAPVKGDVLDL